MLNDVRLLDGRVSKLRTHFRQAGEDIDGIAVSSRKITDRGDKIKNVQLEEAAVDPPSRGLKRSSDPGRGRGKAGSLPPYSVIFRSRPGPPAPGPGAGTPAPNLRGHPV